MKTEQAIAIRNEVKQTVNAVLDGEKLYNADYNCLKDKASRAIDTFIQDAKDATYLSAGYVAKDNETKLYYDLSGLTVTNFPSGKLSKELVKDDTDFYKAVLKVADEWAEISNCFKEIKKRNLIIKGHKPSQRKTKERTTENTGTCPCCHRNIKLDDGKIVHHGFEISHGFRNGACFGVGYLPLEVSPEGKSAFLKQHVLKLYAEVQNKDSITHAKEIRETVGMGRHAKNVTHVCGTPEFARLQKQKLAQIEGNIRYLKASIEQLSREIAAWTRKPLPGAK